MFWGEAMSEEIERKQQPIKVPEKYFRRWHQEEIGIARSKLRYGLAEASLPHLTIIVIFMLTALIYPPALIGTVPALLHLIFKISQKK